MGRGGPARITLEANSLAIPQALVDTGCDEGLARLAGPHVSSVADLGPEVQIAGLYPLSVALGAVEDANRMRLPIGPEVLDAGEGHLTPCRSPYLSTLPVIATPIPVVVAEADRAPV